MAVVTEVRYVDVSVQDLRQQAGELLRGQVGYNGGMPPPVVGSVQRRPKDRSGIKRVPCGGGYRVIRKRVGNN